MNQNELNKAIDIAIVENPTLVEDYKGGRLTALGALVAAAKRNAGAVNLKELQGRITERLNAEKNE